MKFEECKEILFETAKKAGLTEFDVYYERASECSTDALKEEINSFTSNTSGGICFRCVLNGKMGCASTELMAAEEMRQLVARAMAGARMIDSEEAAIIYDGKDAVYAETKTQVPPMVTAEALKAKVLSLQAAAYAASDKVGDGTESYAFTFESEERLANSHGLDLCAHSGNAGVYSMPVVRDGESAADHAESGKFDEDDKALASLAVETALSKIGAGTVETGKYALVIDGKPMRQLLAAYASGFSAKNAQLGLSPLAGKENQKVAASCVTLTDDPMREGCPIAQPFDGEGVPTARRAVIEKGVLQTLLYDLSTAAKAGKTTTGNGQRAGYAGAVAISPFCFCIEAGKQTREDLCATIGDGVLITEVTGLHAGVDPVTGDFSIQSAGYRVKNGKKAEAVRNFTMAGNFFTLLQNIEAVSDTVETGLITGFPAYGSPAVLVRDMTLAGK